MAFKDIFWNYGRYVELLAYVLAFISVFLPFLHGTLDNWHEVKMLGNVYRDAISVSYIHYKPGVCVFIFTIISALLVLLALFAGGFIRKLQNRSNGNIIDAIVELLPLHFTLNSIVLSFISVSDIDGIRPAGNISIGAGYYLLLLALLVAAVIRIVYLFMKYGGSNCSSEPNESKIVVEDSYAIEV